MKKFLTAALITMMSLSFVGCTNSTDTKVTNVNGTYRGGFIDGSVVVELALTDDTITEIQFKKLKYGETDFLAKDATEVTKLLAGQYQALIDHLVGKDLSAINDLYTPENIVETIDGLASASSKEGEVIDTLSGATVRSGKVISAINDSINRGAYKLAK